MPKSPCIGVLILALSLLISGPAQAGPQGQPMRVYNDRMEALFVSLDANSDGKLDAGELKDQRALRRRLKRQQGRSYLLLEDLRAPGGEPGGKRLPRRLKPHPLVVPST